MQDFIDVTGLVLKQSPVGEYDRRITLLTKERGKLAAFAKSARKQGSRFGASTCPFCFGTFRLFEGKSSYTVSDADISNYFEELMKDYEGAYYGMYFAEIADYYTRENNDETDMLKLIYQSLRALTTSSLDRRLVKAIYEIKSITVNGEFPGISEAEAAGMNESTVYAVRFIERTPIEKLYTFAVTDEVLTELSRLAAEYRKRYMDRNFKSLEIIENL
ncbi:MAG: DNA repair protein RecO [Lachnospiraceae bacterium]|nr:DNA repair protein RecO [Lachnospiraceae bacterium]